MIVDIKILGESKSVMSGFLKEWDKSLDLWRQRLQQQVWYKNHRWQLLHLPIPERSGYRGSPAVDPQVELDLALVLLGGKAGLWKILGESKSVMSGFLKEWDKSLDLWRQRLQQQVWYKVATTSFADSLERSGYRGSPAVDPQVELDLALVLLGEKLGSGSLMIVDVKILGESKSVMSAFLKEWDKSLDLWRQRLQQQVWYKNHRWQLLHLPIPERSGYRGSPAVDPQVELDLALVLLGEKLGSGRWQLLHLPIPERSGYRGSPAVDPQVELDLALVLLGGKAGLWKILGESKSVMSGFLKEWDKSLDLWRQRLQQQVWYKPHFEAKRAEISSHSQMTKTTSEIELHSPDFLTTPT
ncbi:hypothetical protein TNCV_4281701 [Trichonephila clavipes]|nr:hypothetical protein TNCV_4281701 [Trichonephila clavipes]